MPWRKWAYKPVGPDPDTDPEAAAGSADDDEKLTQESTPLTTPLHRERPAVTAAAAAAAAAGGGGGGSSPFPLGAAAAAAAAAAVLFFLVLFVFTPRPWLPADRAPQVAHYTCGNSTAAATAAGCKFDVMSYTWVHPRCFDQELMYEFLGRAGWRWYLGEGEAGAEAEALALEDVAKGQHEYVYVTWEYYVTHCTYSKSFFSLLRCFMKSSKKQVLTLIVFLLQCGGKCTGLC